MGFDTVKELTTEEIVTNLLSSNEILKRDNKKVFITSPINLGEYLDNLPQELSSKNIELFDNKYSFIKGNGWKF